MIVSAFGGNYISQNAGSGVLSSSGAVAGDSSVSLGIGQREVSTTGEKVGDREEGTLTCRESESACDVGASQENAMFSETKGRTGQRETEQRDDQFTHRITQAEQQREASTTRERTGQCEEGTLTCRESESACCVRASQQAVMLPEHQACVCGEEMPPNGGSAPSPPPPRARAIPRLALEAMLVEVSVTPKPGLVDRNNSGAHNDMDYFTFLKSAAGLRSSFDDFANAGTLANSPRMFNTLRAIGLNAERDMFQATNGINTHKGEIFSLGVIAACAAYLSQHGQELTDTNIPGLAKTVCEGLCAHDFAQTLTKPRETLTKGERVYIEHGIAGIRGEAEAGYPVVMNAGLPALRKYLAEGLSMNDALAFTLVHIMAVNHDTNIISRHNINTSHEVMNISRKLIDEGITLAKLYALDDEFIARNISPSGSADLLAVTYFIYSLTNH